MKDTNPPRESVSSLSYRDAETTPTATAPVLVALAGAALARLAHEGAASPGGENAGDTSWTVRSDGSDGPLEIRCTGPDLPESIPGELAHPSMIPFERPWVPTYRLVVRAPLIVLDLAWRAGDPLRIMTFSRGEWEAALVAPSPA